MKTRWLDRNIAAPGPYLTLCLSREEFLAVMKRLKVPWQSEWCPQERGCVRQFKDPTAGLCCVVCLNGVTGRDPIEVAGLIIHEAVHVWQAYAEDIGEESAASEQEAYAIQCIAQELMSEFSRRMKEQ